MKLIAYLAAALTIISGALAVDVQKQVIISYPDDTPDWVIAEAKEAIIKAGGAITHEYNLIKGFAATAGEKILANVKAMGSQFQALVEEDQVVGIVS